MAESALSALKGLLLKGRWHATPAGPPYLQLDSRHSRKDFSRRATFFTPKRVFAMFANNHHGDGHVAVWVPAPPGVQAALIEEAPAPTSGPRMLGVAGWVGVELSRVNDEQLGA